MNKEFVSFPITDYNRTKQQVLAWANQSDICCFLDNHQYSSGYNNYQCIAGVGSEASIESPSGEALNRLQQFQQNNKGWLFGHLGYDLKNETQGLSSSNPDPIGFPDLFFFAPVYVLLLNNTEISIGCNTKTEANAVFEDIANMPIQEPEGDIPKTFLQQRLSKQEYIATIKTLQQHILRGDCYEINYCQEFFAVQIQLDPLLLYQSLSKISPNPFAAYYKLHNKYLLCASPERFLQKRGNTVCSQPIKGTAKRDVQHKERDAQIRKDLQLSTKNRAENVMVVDLVRNDLSRICKPGSVEVKKLFEVVAFPQVFQMISTIIGELQPGTDFANIMRNCFPMGSMTGAPKRSVLELIERYEKTKRGLFSAGLGYIDPKGDFDFNVVIRSMLYNKEKAYLSCPVGSGITFYSNAEEEYEECLLKVAAIKKLLE